MPLKNHVAFPLPLPAKVRKNPNEDNSPMQIFLFFIILALFLVAPSVKYTYQKFPISSAKKMDCGNRVCRAQESGEYSENPFAT